VVEQAGFLLSAGCQEFLYLERAGGLCAGSLAAGRLWSRVSVGA
jgi:hypothetical protein